jgi:hypothetical protein
LHVEVASRCPRVHHHALDDTALAGPLLAIPGEERRKKG